MKGSSGDEKNVIGSNHAVTRIYSRPFDDRQDVPLYTFTRNIWPMTGFTTSYFVYLVQEDNAGVFNALNRGSRDLVHVDETFFLFLHQVLHRFVHAHLPSLRTPLEHIAQHVFHVDAHLFNTLWTSEFNYRETLLAYFELNQTVVELAAAKLRTQLFSRLLKLLIAL